jgi:hypothetical protein
MWRSSKLMKRSPVAFLMKEVNLLVDCQKYFCRKVSFSSNATYIVNAVLPDSLDKMMESVCQNAGLPNDILAGKAVGLELEDYRVKACGTDTVIFADALTSSWFPIKPPVCPKNISIRRDFSLLLAVLHLAEQEGRESAWGGFVGPAKKSSPKICQNSFGEDNFAESIVFKQLAEFDVESSVGLSIVEGDEILA